MPQHDNDDIVTELEDEPKHLSKAKTDQLAAARVKALDSRRRTQKAGLEARLHEVRLLLGELDPKHMERVLEAMVSQERDLRRKQSELTTQLIEMVKAESAKRSTEYESLKRSIDRIRRDLSQTGGAVEMHKTHAIPHNARSVVSVAPSVTSKLSIPLAKVSSHSVLPTR